MEKSSSHPLVPGCRCELCVGEARARLLEIMAKIPNAPLRGSIRTPPNFNDEEAEAYLDKHKASTEFIPQPVEEPSA